MDRFYHSPSPVTHIYTNQNVHIIYNLNSNEGLKWENTTMLIIIKQKRRKFLRFIRHNCNLVRVKSWDLKNWKNLRKISAQNGHRIGDIERVSDSESNTHKCILQDIQLVHCFYIRFDLYVLVCFIHYSTQSCSLYTQI